MAENRNISKYLAKTAKLLTIYKELPLLGTKMFHAKHLCYLEKQIIRLFVYTSVYKQTNISTF